MPVGLETAKNEHNRGNTPPFHMAPTSCRQHLHYQPNKHYSVLDECTAQSLRTNNALYRSAQNAPKTLFWPKE